MLGADHWRRVEMKLDGMGLAAATGLTRPAWFSLAVQQSRRTSEVAQLGLLDPNGRSILANGNFASGGARWIRSGRYFFLPWHTDSLWLELLVERGIAGLAIWLGLLAPAFHEWHRSSGAIDLASPWFLASVLSLMVVGSFGSVIDGPRLPGKLRQRVRCSAPCIRVAVLAWFRAIRKMAGAR